MTEELSLSPVPVGENCAQVGEPSYSEQSRKECRAFVNQLKRIFGEPPAGSCFKIKSNPHDFGSYLDVVVVFNDDNEEASDYAYNVEGDLPEYWDEEAKKELEEAGYTLVKY